MKNNWIAYLLVAFFALVRLHAQEQPDPLFVAKIAQPITLDGNLDEPAWQRSKPADNFWNYFPNDTSRASYQTEIYMLYDDKNLYIGAKCYAAGQNYITPSLRRDFRAGGNDNLTFLFDPFTDQTNAFVFGINPFGVMREALVANGGRDFRTDWDDSWDNKWTGTSSIHDGYWSCEIAIPFTTLRYTEGSTEWRFNSYRFDTQSNSNSTWARIPRNQIIMDLGYMGRMIWEQPLRKPGANFSLIPYVAASHTQEFDPERMDPVLQLNAGGDAKIGVTPGLNLDLTINPDFSQVEVDQQVTNLDRFEIFFPERRQFFLENADLFSGFGTARANPFFSRRIGIAQDTSTGNNIQNPILFGARLSGKLDNYWRLGILNMQTAADAENDLPSFNYAVAAVQRRIGMRSNVGVIFVNKESFGSEDDNGTYDPYNRTFGLDYNLASSDNSWIGKAYLHRSFSATEKEQPFSHGFRLLHQQRPFRVEWNHQWIGEGFDAQVGFVPRSNFFNINPSANLFYYPENGWINRHGPGVEVLFFWQPELGKTDHQFAFGWEANFANSADGNIRINHNYTYLFEPFDPSGIGDQELASGTSYSYINVEGRYQSDRRKVITYEVNPTFGQFYNGNRYGLSGQVAYRYQPYGSVAINFNYNYIDLPRPFQSSSLVLIGPRVDMTFTKNIFLTTFFQYNNQIDNFNINARFQWRFAPVSDFFLVYTDNYYASDFQGKNRAIIAKLTYWLNL
ncbi:MAG: carbohydrate binding family 9 domain-containing protein [Saprospiraceae bacterium]|nr:carbohydrate binding family 9 domain-containing protein [Saprospiraceae bacterium]